MSNVGCSGNEANIELCSSRITRNCTQNEGAGVVCDISKPSVRLVGGKTTQLFGGNTTYEGNVLVNDKPIW